MAAGNHLAPRQTRFWQGREPGKGIGKLKQSGGGGQGIGVGGEKEDV